MPRRSSSLTQVVDGAIDREINSKYDDVKIVADNIDDVIIVANATATTAAVVNNIDSITTIGSSIADIVAVNSNIADVTSVADNIVDMSVVATNIGDIRSVVTTVVPNMAEILLADDRATTATSMAVTATTQAGLANTARVAAEVAKGIAETKATEAGLSAVAADLSADLAAVSAAAAHTSELAAAALLDAFDDRYLGSYSVDPALDNDGQALLDGTLYYNTVGNVLKVYDVGSAVWYTIPQVVLSSLLDVQLTSVATGDVLSWNGSKWVNTKALTVNSVQLLGGISTQGTMTWNADEETVDVVQNGAVLQLGQETQVHVRNNSGSSIADGKVVMATGTLGASGRITAGLYNGAADVKYVLGVATETIANGDDGKVTSFGKIRGINTSAWNEGDVLYTTTAGGLTNVAPVTGVKLAVAFVITKHAINGTIMVRVNGVDELRYEPKNTNIQTHIASTSNPHSVTKTQVGLSNVDNTADVSKNVLYSTTAGAITGQGALATLSSVNASTITDNSVGAAELNVTGNGTTSQYLRSDGDGTFTWATPTDTTMSKAAFNAIASERRANRAGSGFDEMGKHHSDMSNYPNVNEGLLTNNTFVNKFLIGRNGVSETGVSRTSNPVANINGLAHIVKYTAGTAQENTILLPPAPTVLPYDATLTQQQIDSGVIKHADASNSGLIVNGKFDMDTSGWSNFDASLSIDTNRLKITSNAGSMAGTFGVQTLSNLVVGKKYIVEFNVISISSGSLLFRVGSGTTNQPFNYIHSVTPTIGRNSIEFTATLTSHHIFAGLVTSTGQNAIYDNIAVFPSDAISRSDLVFLESWHEDVSEKDFVYPLGNVQYLGTTGDSGAPVVGAFAGSATYSLFSDTWQADGALVGKGYVWSALSDVNKKAFVANSENNCYLDGDRVIQVRYRMRVVQGFGDSWARVEPKYYNLADFSVMAYGGNSTSVVPKGKKTSMPIYDLGTFTANSAFVPSGNINTGFNPYYNGDIGFFSCLKVTGQTLDITVAYEGKCFALPIALIHRRNQGGYHPVYNPNGTKLASDGNKWYNTAVSFTSIADCFTDTKLMTASGYIGTTSARPDGLFYDQIHEGDITDLRMNSAKVEDYNRLIDREFNKLVAGTYRGQQGELNTEVKTQTTTGTVATVEVNDGTRYKSGDVVYIYDLTASAVKGRFVVKSISTNTLTVDVSFAKLANSYMISGGSTTRTKSNTITVTDLIGSPSNLPVNMKLDGQSFNTLHTAEDGTSLLPTGALTVFKLSRKANATPLQVLKSNDSGATWTALTVTTHYTFSTTTNAITMVTAPAVGDLVMVTYQTHTNMVIAGANSEVLSIGNVSFYDYYTSAQALQQSIINKINTNAITSGFVAVTSSITSSPYYCSTSKFETSIAFSPLSHPAINAVSSTSPTVKLLPYLTRLNGKARLQLVFKEMKYNGTSWGDDSKFNIVDNVSTTTDNNAQTVLIGQKYAELPYFISAGE